MANFFPRWSNTILFQIIACVAVLGGGISLAVDEADFVTIIGSNGAGKSTTLRTISGLNHPSSGSIVFDGQPIEELSADRIVKLGIAHVPEAYKNYQNC